MHRSTESKQDCRRRRIYVDADVQYALLRHLVLSWIVVIGVIAAVLLGVESYRADFALGFIGSFQALWNHNAPLVITICVLSPFILYDSVKLSHRFVGPMVSFRRAMTQLQEGKPVRPIHFRRDDFWHDLAESFNGLLARVNQLESGQCSSCNEADFVDSHHNSI